MKTKHDQNRTSPEVVLKAWMIGVVLAVMVALGGLSCPVLSANMITDGDFSTDPLALGATGWGTYSPTAPVATYTWNSAGKYETMTYTDGNTNWLVAAFALVPEIDDQGYDFSADINCHDAHESQGLNVAMWWYQAGNLVTTTDLVPQRGGTAGWTTFSKHIDSAPATADNAWIVFEGRWYGTMDIDNVSFAAVPEPATMCLLALGGLLTLVKRRRRA